MKLLQLCDMFVDVWEAFKQGKLHCPNCGELIGIWHPQEDPSGTTIYIPCQNCGTLHRLEDVFHFNWKRGNFK